MMNKLILPIFFIFLTSTLFAQHVWERSNPGGGGAIAMVGATADGTILAASDLSGVYKTTNNGLSWEVLGSKQGLLSTNITCFGFHPTDGKTFLIGTGLGAYKTTDGGNTIYPVNIETDPNLGIGFVESMAMDMTNGNIGYMAHHEWWRPELSLLKTTDGGENWKILTTTGLAVDARITKFIVDHNDPNLVYALTGKARYGCSKPNLYKSNNGGLNWTEIADFADILDVDLHPTDPNTIYVSTFVANDCSVPMWEYVGGNETTGELYKSTNGGNSFTEIGDKTGIISVGTNPNHISVIDIFLPYDWNPNAGTWKTTNGGTNWNHTGIVQNWFTGWSGDSYLFALSFNGVSKTLTKNRFNPDKLYGAFGQWAWSSIDGGNVLNNISTTSYGNGQYASTGLENIEGHCIDVSDANPNTVYMGGYDLGFWYSRNHGDSWKRSLPDMTTYPDYSWYAGGGSSCNIVLNDPERENVVWASFSADQPNTQSALFKSDEFGENWAISNTGLDPFGPTMHGLSLDINSPINNRTLYLTQNGDVFKSTDDGNTWTKKLQVGGLKFTAVDQINSQLVYAGGENGLWRSLDGGNNWTNVGLTEMSYIPSGSGALMVPDIIPTFGEPWATPVIDPWAGVFDIKTDPNQEGRVYVVAYGSGKGLYKSDDNGITWTKIYTNSRMRGVAITPSNSNVLYASSSLSYHSGSYDVNSIGFKVSYDAGETWGDANDGLAWTHGGRMDIESGNEPHLWAWSPGTGIQHTPIPNLTIQDVDQDQDGFLSADDCDDNNANINPNQPEIAYNGLDDDCNAATRDDDLDQDGFLLANDCDDNNANINSNQAEVAYNGLDDDCNAATLDDDLDQDGFLLANDCDDNNAKINPNQSEIAYNGLDDDCNAATLDDDLDQDGFLLADDCDDNNKDINPGMEEIPNNAIDEDCNGIDLVTSIHELANTVINIYPNPVIDLIHIDITGTLKYNVTIYNSSGKILLSETNQPLIQIQSFPTGTYFLEIKDLNSNDKIVEKIIKSK